MIGMLRRSFRRFKCFILVLVVICFVIYWSYSSIDSIGTEIIYERREVRNNRGHDSGLNYLFNGDDFATTTESKIYLDLSNEPMTKHSLGKIQKNVSKLLNECNIGFDFRDTKRMLMAPEKKVDADCPSLFKGSLNYARTIRRKLKTWTNDVTDTGFMNTLTANCSITRKEFASSFYVSQSEKIFPLAFEFLVHYKPTHIQQYIRLLKNIYRPHNVYCIHIDGKAPDWWANMLISFAGCFSNIIIAKHRIKVDYGTSKILYAHFSCFSDLLESEYEWKYVISLHGTELPLATNREMVEILQKMNGTNLIQKGEDSSKESAQSHPWITYKVKSINDGKKVVLTNETLGPIPYNTTIFKSAASANSAFSRKFVSFIFSDEKSIALANFLKDVQSAVEMFFSSVNSFPNAPGGYNTFHGNVSDMPLVAKRDWVFRRKAFKKYCFSRKLVHNICIVSSSDLERLGKVSNNRSWWFHNKYFIEYDHVVMNCMENLLLQRNANEYRQDCL